MLEVNLFLFIEIFDLIYALILLVSNVAVGRHGKPGAA